MSEVRTEMFILLGAVLFALFTFPTNYMTATAVLALIAYLLSKSVVTVLGIFIGAAILRIFLPVEMKSLPGSDVPISRYTEQQKYRGKEGFQPKDPISVHQRITSNKTGEPLKPLNTITGVLESPDILNSLQISAVLPVEQGGSMCTGPASLKAPEIIATPPELSPSSATVGLKPAPQANPVLQFGEDVEGVATALVTKGTALFNGHPSSNVAGMNAHASP